MDYDNDGWRDLFMANGHVLDNIERYHADVHYAEPKLMFRNTGRGIFENVSDRLGPDFQRPRVSRGAAIGDFDNDGDLDILVNNNGEPAQLLRNDGGNANHWLEIFLIGTRSNRDGVGARVKLTAGDLDALRPAKGRHELPIRAGSAAAFWLGSAHVRGFDRNHLAERRGDEAWRPEERSDYRVKEERGIGGAAVPARERKVEID